MAKTRKAEAASISAKKKPTQKKTSQKKTADKQVAQQATIVQTPATALTRVHARPARALIGWLPPDAAQAALAGPGAKPPHGPDIEARVARAHAAVAARTPHATAVNIISDPPRELDAHIAELTAQPFFRQFAAEGGWRVQIADLRSVRALQPVVHTDHSSELTQGAGAGDLVALARITLPPTRAKETVAAVLSADGRGWVVTCRNPQLRIRGPNSADRDDNGYKTKVLGIETEVVTSLVQVARWRGVYVLRDGYHRTHGLLSQGITTVPVLYKEFPDQQPPLVQAGLFDPGVYGGEHAPLLLDYLDDEVSAAIEVRRVQKTFIIQVQAMELDTPIL